MTPDVNSLARRTLIKSAGLGLGACVVSQLMPVASQHAAEAGADLGSHEDAAKKGDVALYLCGKRIGAPKPGEVPRPVLFLVHGSSISSRSPFDLTVAGRGEYSLMIVLARLGFDVWTMDQEN